MIIPQYHKRGLSMDVAGRLCVYTMALRDVCCKASLTSFVITGCLSMSSSDACVYVSTYIFIGTYCILFVLLMFLASGGALYIQINNLRIRISKLKGTLGIF